ncbi:MAG: sulfite exporter TauE/SafE family protein [Mycobacterium sp.]
MSEPPGRSVPNLDFLAAAAAARDRADRRRARLAIGFSILVTLAWFVGVLLTDNFGRVWDNIVATPTMMFGSFVAGSTPQGGGAVAFPVFTKGLGVPSEVARTFSLAIQSVGMTAATVAILLRRRAIDVPAVLWSLPMGIIGLFLGLFLLSDRSRPFWPSILPGAYVKVLFTLLVLAMAFVVFLGSRVPIREVRTSVSPLGRRQIAFLMVGALLGGLASSQVGSGSDVLFYLVVVVMLGLEPRIGVPSSVLVMTAVSLTGFVYLGLIQGHLDIAVAGGEVTRVGATIIADPSQYPADRFDLLGLWLAAVPVVCWGAPLGSAFAARITSRQLAMFVAVLAAAEGVTTIVFVRELRTDPGLIAFGVVGAAVLVGGLWLCVRYRHRVAEVRFDPSASITRESVDVGGDYVRDAESRRDAAGVDDPQCSDTGGGTERP